ncbi:hypothetical protein N9L71_05545 [Verrucomicrobiales bacterium]|jgi:hypothetical protein|nr:hypothetical protein [Verrucomicrobiales bacterium]
MNLRDQLKEILPDILPRNPAQAIKGTELIEMVKHRLKQDYSDATLRYHFSIMSCDPSSPIAKVEQGQGYYLRTSTIHTVNSARNLFHTGSDENGVGMSSADMDVSLARAAKFRAVVQRYLESVQQFPFSFERSFTIDAEGNRWRVPDLAVVDWLAGEESEDSVSLNKEKLEVQRRLGQSPMRVSSVKLRLELNHFSLYEDLYQCLATSEWANAAELLIAAPIEDRRMIEEVRRFASRYGIGVISFGLDADVLDDMPEPAAIENLQSREFESIQSLLQIRRYAAPDTDQSYDWAHVLDAAAENPDFDRFEKWISRCLLDEKAMTSREYDDLERKAAPVEEYVA